MSANGKRSLVDIEPPLRSKADKAKAIEAAKLISTLSRDPTRFAAKGDGGELAADWFERWIADKKARGQRSIGAVRAHLKGFVAPAIGPTPMADVSREQLEALVQALDRKVAAGEMRWKYAINVWGTVTKAFDDACEGKVLDLRCRDDNPAAKVRGPDRGVETEQVHLFPSEFLQLVACRAVPLFRRRYYTIAIYCYLRPGELEALSWSDIDLKREIIHVRHGIDRDTEELQAPKAKRARAPFTIEPELLPLLRVMHKESGGAGRVVGDLGDERKLAEILRRDLITAGVTRTELHECSKKPPREWMVMHGCRHTGVTWMAVRGDEPLMVMARAGHQDMKTTLGYVNRAALMRKAYGQPFPKLPKAMLRSRQLAEQLAEKSPSPEKTGPNRRKRMGIEPTGRPVKDEPTRFEDGGGHQSRAHFRGRW